MDLTLRTLAAFPDQVEALFAAFPPDARTWAPASWEGIPSEALTAHEQICHLRDIEKDGYQVRIRRTLTEDHPFLPSLDTMRLAAGYGALDAAEALQGFRAARVETLRLLTDLEDSHWRRPAIFEGYGPTTLCGLVHFLCSHDQQHLAGLQWLLGRLEAPPEDLVWGKAGV